MIGSYKSQSRFSIRENLNNFLSLQDAVYFTFYIYFVKHESEQLYV